MGPHGRRRSQVRQSPRHQANQLPPLVNPHHEPDSIPRHPLHRRLQLGGKRRLSPQQQPNSIPLLLQRRTLNLQPLYTHLHHQPGHPHDRARYRSQRQRVLARHRGLGQPASHRRPPESSLLPHRKRLHCSRRLPAIYGSSAENSCLPRSIWQKSVLALDMTTGKPNWIRRLSPLDAWTLGYGVPGVIPQDPMMCPQTPGQDADFGMA